MTLIPYFRIFATATRTRLVGWWTEYADGTWRFKDAVSHTLLFGYMAHIHGSHKTFVVTRTRGATLVGVGSQFVGRFE